jgi:hypothetical protein
MKQVRRKLKVEPSPTIRQFNKKVERSVRQLQAEDLDRLIRYGADD